MQTSSPKSDPAAAPRPAARVGAGIAPAAGAPRPPAEAGWTIDTEPADRGWHESSWLLRRGLDVIESVPPQFWPAEWRRAWQ